METGIPKAIQEKLIQKILAVFPKTAAIYLYGSAVNGTLNLESDLDFALLMRPGTILNPWNLFELRSELESIAGRRVDITQLDSSKSTVHSKEVVAGGMAIYCADERIKAEFEMKTLSQYAQYRRDLDPVIRSYSANG